MNSVIVVGFILLFIYFIMLYKMKAFSYEKKVSFYILNLINYVFPIFFIQKKREIIQTYFMPDISEKLLNNFKNYIFLFFCLIKIFIILFLSFLLFYFKTVNFILFFTVLYSVTFLFKLFFYELLRVCTINIDYYKDFFIIIWKGIPDMSKNNKTEKDMLKNASTDYLHLYENKDSFKFIQRKQDNENTPVMDLYVQLMAYSYGYKKITNLFFISNEFFVMVDIGCLFLMMLGFLWGFV